MNNCCQDICNIAKSCFWSLLNIQSLVLSQLFHGKLLNGNLFHGQKFPGRIHHGQLLQRPLLLNNQSLNKIWSVVPEKLLPGTGQVLPGQMFPTQILHGQRDFCRINRPNPQSTQQMSAGQMLPGKMSYGQMPPKKWSISMRNVIQKVLQQFWVLQPIS